MPQHTTKPSEVGNIAKGSPAVGVPLAVAKVGEKVIEKTPAKVRRAVKRTVKRIGTAARKARSYVRRKVREVRHRGYRRR